jgi:hypothetical protein
MSVNGSDENSPELQQYIAEFIRNNQQLLNTCTRSLNFEKSGEVFRVLKEVRATGNRPATAFEKNARKVIDKNCRRNVFPGFPGQYEVIDALDSHNCVIVVTQHVLFGYRKSLLASSLVDIMMVHLPEDKKYTADVLVCFDPDELLSRYVPQAEIDAAITAVDWHRLSRYAPEEIKVCEFSFLQGLHLSQPNNRRLN